MKKSLAIIFFNITVLVVNAQQVGSYSHDFFKPMIYNPAFTGYDDLNTMIINRSQWTEFKGAPQLNLVTLDGNLVNKKVGLGLVLISDRKGITNRIGGNVNYSYKLNLNDETHLMFGISVGIIDQSVYYSKALVENASDPLLFSDDQRKTVLDANAGLGFVWKELEVGFAVPELAGNKINYVDNTNTRAFYTHARHYMGSLKYKVFISKEKEISVIPEALIRFVPNTPFQYDASLLFDWKEKFWIGGTYKSNYAVAANLGICLHRQLSVGYSYDFILGDLGKYSGMSHELMINFKFGKNKKEEKEENDALAKLAAKNDLNEKRLDSLQNELTINQDKVREDQRKIKENQDKLTELNNKIDQQAKELQEVKTNPIQQRIEEKEQVQQNPETIIDQNKNQNQAINNTQTPLKQNNQETPSGNKNNQQAPVKSNENQNSAAVAANVNKTLDAGVWIVSGKTKDFKDESEHNPQIGYYVIAGTFFYKDFAKNEVKRLKNSGFKSANFFYFEPKQFNYVFIAKEKTKEAALKKVNEAKAAGIKDAWIQMLVE